jgi:hypothetical protein
MTEMGPAEPEMAFCPSCKRTRSVSRFSINARTGKRNRICDCKLRIMRNLENDSVGEIVRKIRLQTECRERSRISKYTKSVLKEKGFCWCSLCKNAIPAQEFGGQSLSRCRKCNSARVKASQTESSKLKAKESSLLRQYGMSLADLREMYEAHDGRCGICKIEHPFSGPGSLVVDHCHDTGKVRGMLCGRCNSAIGLFKENMYNLVQAMNYLFYFHGPKFKNPLK